MAIYAEVHLYGFMRESGDFLDAAERRKGAVPHWDYTRLFITFTHMALT